MPSRHALRIGGFAARARPSCTHSTTSSSSTRAPTRRSSTVSCRRSRRASSIGSSPPLTSINARATQNPAPCRRTREMTMTLRTKLMLLGLPLALGACSEVASKEPEVRTVRTVVANPTPVDDDRRAVGEVRPRYESELGFRVSGKVITRLVDVGATVNAGEALARLDDQDYRNKLRTAEADLVSAQAVQVEAAAAEERYRLDRKSTR